jgi:hypothetical protein
MAAVALGCLGLSVAIFIPWFVVARLRVRRSVEVPEGSGETMELRPEPPAVVNALVERFRPTPDAVAATLLDLAARGWLTLEQIEPDRYVCRLRGKEVAGAELLPFELRVLDLVQRTAVDGVAQVRDLAAKTDASTVRFWALFAAEVRLDVQQRGLGTMTPAGDIGGTITWGLAWMVPLVLAPSVVAPEGFLVWGVGGGIIWIVASILATATRSLHPTPDGRAAAAHWLAVRRYLSNHGSFDTLPPAAVTVWDRYLAYSTALGLSPGAIEGLLLEIRTSMSGRDWRELVGAIRQAMRVAKSARRAQLQTREQHGGA